MAPLPSAQIGQTMDSLEMDPAKSRSKTPTTPHKFKPKTTRHQLALTLLLALVTLVKCSSSSSSNSPKYPQQLYTIVTNELSPPGARASGGASSWDNRQLAARQLVLDHSQAEEDETKGVSSHARKSPAELRRQFDSNEVVRVDRWPAAPVGAARGGKRAPTSGSGSPTRATTKTRRRSPVGANGTKRTPSRPSAAGARKGVAEWPPLESPTLAADGANATSPKRQGGRRKNLVCYYGTWAVYRPDAGKFAVENIDPFLCTHVIYGFTGLSFDNLIKPLDPWNDLEDNYGKGAMKRFTNLKRQNPELKTLVAIGGWNEGSIKYSKMASEPEARARFVDSVVKFLAKYNFDGLDLDWEYPGSRGGASYDKQNFVRLLRELHHAFRPHGYLLTAAVSAGKWFIDPAYDIGQVSKYLDLINLMAYDYHGGWETKTGMNAPLFASPKHDLSREDRMLNVNWSVNYWLAQGAAREKLMLGVGSYGRSFTLDRESENGINAPASQKGRAGPYTREPGSLGYNEICEQLEKGANTWTIVRDPDYLAPYAFTNNGQRQWVGYDDQQSLALKAEFAKSMGLGGMMMWSIETDDFQGRCHGGEKFPLLNTIRRVLDGSGGGVSQASTTPPPAQGSTSSSVSTTPGHEIEEVDQQQPQRPTSTSRPRPPTQPVQPASTSRRPAVIAPTSSTTKRPISTTRRPAHSSSTTTAQPQRPTPTASQEFSCQSDGMFADPRNCRKFIRCVGAGTPSAQRFTFDCGPGTAFSEQLQACDHIYNVATCRRPQQQQQHPEHAQEHKQVLVTTHQFNGADNHLHRRQLVIVPAPPPPRHLMLAHHFYPMPTILHHQPAGFLHH